MTDDLMPLRLVIQQLNASEDASYRVVVYGDSLLPLHSDFACAGILLAALRAAVPKFDLSKLLLNPLAAGQGSIVYAGVITLTRDQLSLLELS